MSRLTDIEVAEDLTPGARADEGFLRVRRLKLRNVYADGTRSEPYACDVVSRRRTDAVAIVLYDQGAKREVRVLLRRGLRPPVTLRREKALAHEETRPLLLAEIVAGVLEAEDDGAGGIEARATREAAEEAGVALEAARVVGLGAPLFPSPGITDERVHYRAARADLVRRTRAPGDGSPMEAGAEIELVPLREAIRRCRTGGIADMKTEVGLLRLADLLGYLPQLDLFVDELPPDLARAARGLPPLLEPPEGAP